MPTPETPSSEPTTRGPGLLGAVLVGGASRRLGADKARLRLRGRMLGERVAAVLGTVCGEVVLVARGPLAPGDPLLAVAPVIHDHHRGRGPLGGLHAALLYGGGRPVLLAACDLPGLSPELVRHLVQQAGTRDREPARGWVPRVDGRLQPLCAVYGAACLAPVEARLSGDEHSMHGLLEAIDLVAVPLGPHLPFWHPHLLANLNRPEDLEAWQRRCGEAP